MSPGLVAAVNQTPAGRFGYAQMKDDVSAGCYLLLCLPPPYLPRSPLLPLRHVASFPDILLVQRGQLTGLRGRRETSSHGEPEQKDDTLPLLGGGNIPAGILRRLVKEERSYHHSEPSGFHPC